MPAATTASKAPTCKCRICCRLSDLASRRKLEGFPNNGSQTARAQRPHRDKQSYRNSPSPNIPRWHPSEATAATIPTKSAARSSTKTTVWEWEASKASGSSHVGGSALTCSTLLGSTKSSMWPSGGCGTRGSFVGAGGFEGKTSAECLLKGPGVSKASAWGQALAQAPSKQTTQGALRGSGLQAPAWNPHMGGDPQRRKPQKSGPVLQLRLLHASVRKALGDPGAFADAFCQVAAASCRAGLYHETTHKNHCRSFALLFYYRQQDRFAGLGTCHRQHRCDSFGSAKQSQIHLRSTEYRKQDRV